MQNFMLSIQIVLPLFLSISYGYFLKRIGVLEEKLLFKINGIVFHAFFPLLMFQNIYHTKIENVMNIKLICFAVLFLFLLVGILCVVIPKVEKENTKRGVLIQAVYRSNFIIFGLFLVSSLYGEEKTGITSVMIAVIVPLFNMIAVVVLEIFRGGTIHFISIVKKVLKNPLIIGAIFGITAMILSIKLPKPVEETIKSFSSITTPLALVVLGGTFRFSVFHKYIKQLFIGIIGRLIIVPFVGISIGILLGFRNVELVSLLAMTASPVAISSYPMAEQMGGDGELAGQLVIWTSALSIVTIFLWIFGLKQFQMI